MKKKAIKIAASTAVAASAFVAAAPANQADAATNVNQLATDAQNAGTVLKWAISVEGSADYKTQPFAQYNAAKKAIAAAEAAAAKLSTSEKLNIDAKLVEPKLQVKRAQAYIDAITSSEKIQDLTAGLDAAIKTDDIGKVETAYHKATAEYRKQAALLDRVYGQSTRDGIRNEVKPAIEKLVASVKNEVTVSMLAQAAAANVKAEKFEEAAQNIVDAQAILDANNLKWETSLQKSVDDAAISLPLTIKSVVRANATTLTVNFNKPVANAVVADFKVDNKLEITSVVLSKDGKSATLTTTTQLDDTEYTLTYNNKSIKFKTPKVNDNSQISITDVDASLQDAGTKRTYNMTIKNSNGSLYNGYIELSLTADGDVDTITPLGAGTAVIESINGVATGAGATTTWTGNIENGVLSFVVNDISDDTTASVVAIPVVLVDTNGNGAGDSVDEAKAAGKTTFLKGTVETAGATTHAGLSVKDVNKDGKFFSANFSDEAGNAVTDRKLGFDDNDYFYIEGVATTYANFVAALSKGDVIDVNYKPNGKSTFYMTLDNKLVDLTVTSPSKASLRIDNNFFNFTGKGNPGYVVYAFEDKDTVGNTAGQLDADEVQRGLAKGAVVDANGNWSLNINLNQAGANKLVFVQKPNLQGQSLVVGDTGLARTIVEGPFILTAIASVDNGAAEFVGIADTSTLETSPEDSFVVKSNATITLNDTDTTATFTNGVGGTTIEVVAGKVEILYGTPTKISGGDGKLDFGGTIINAVTGIENQDGMKLSLTDTAIANKMIK